MTQDTLTTMRAAKEIAQNVRGDYMLDGNDLEVLKASHLALIAAMEKSEPDFVYEGYERGSELLSALEGVADGTGLWMQKPVEQPLSDAKDAARWNWWAKAVSEHDMNSLEEAFKDIPHDSPTSKQALDSAVDAAIEQAIRSKQA